MERRLGETLPRSARSPAVGECGQLTLFDLPFETHERPAVREPLHTHHRCQRSAVRLRLQPQKFEVHRMMPLTTVGRLFERLYNAFRMKMFDSMGPRYGRILRAAEQDVRFLIPEFDTDSLTDATAPAVLELVEAAIRHSPFFQRPQLRKTACLLVSELYEKHYELLGSAGVRERMEDIYYRLKR